jgi:hypothetical protein
MMVRSLGASVWGRTKYNGELQSIRTSVQAAAKETLADISQFEPDPTHLPIYGSLSLRQCLEGLYRAASHAF